MSAIVRTFAPDFPNLPPAEGGAARYDVSGLIVYATGGQPTPEEVDAFLNHPVPQTITPTQGKRQLFALGLMTSDEVLTGARPAFLQAIIDQMVGGGQAAEAATVVLRWENAIEWRRADPLFAGGLMEAAAQALGQPATPELVDQFFRDAGALT